jgi:hypothetical protein
MKSVFYERQHSPGEDGHHPLLGFVVDLVGHHTMSTVAWACFLLWR